VHAMVCAETLVMELAIKQAREADAPVVADILKEAAAWAQRHYEQLWLESELEQDQIIADVRAGQFFLAIHAGQQIGTLRYQLEDLQFWPDAAEGEAAYVHRLAVRRSWAGRGVAAQMLRWAGRRAVADGRALLRLDTDITRPKLRALYLRCGFNEHSPRQVGPYHVMRYELRLDNLDT